MDNKDRNGRDAAGIGPYSLEREGLVPMSSLESWTMSSGEPDIRGWDVRTVSGRQLGSVSDLLVDQTHGEVVLIDIDLAGTDRHTFAPIRVAEIDRGKRLVLMDSSDLRDEGIVRANGAVVPRDVATVRTVRYPVADRGDAAPVEGDRRQTQRRSVDRIRPESPETRNP
ncbi:MAG TPA: PRC-barrel domain-containing protein [Gemmatimonadaceae bacterium]|jgi:hypothetical protein|nr:PRC-barrel domain-containing protein [Gemmatimonadaceae bacterium]